MKHVLAALLLMIGLIAATPSDAARTGPVEFPMLPSCPTGTGSMINYNATTGVFSCNPITGQTLAWTAPQTFGVISGSIINVTTQGGTSYTLLSTDCGTRIVFTSNSAVTVTMPNSLVVGCSVSIVQYGTAKVSVTAASGGALRSGHSFTGTAAQYSKIDVTVDTNVGGAAANWTLTGDAS